MSGFWYSSPIFFQKSTLAKMPSSGCRSFSSRMCCASPGFGAVSLAPAVGGGDPCAGVAGALPCGRSLAEP